MMILEYEYEKKPIEVRAIEALGQGFDLASDFRLKFVKRRLSTAAGGRESLLLLDQHHKRDVILPGGVTILDVPECIHVNNFRLKFVKRRPSAAAAGGESLLLLDQHHKRDVVLPGCVTIPDVPECIRVDKGDRIRFKSDVLQFNQMSELLNQKSSIQGKVPSGYLNAIFNLSGAWLSDAADAKYLLKTLISQVFYFV